MASDSVSIFAEGTFEEQIQELVNYLARGLSDEERTACIRPFQEALLTPQDATPLAADAPRRSRVLTMVLNQIKSLGEGNEREIEGFFNLIYAHLFTAFPIDGPDVAKYLPALVKIIESTPQTVVAYRLLSNLFNAVPKTSKYRLQVYTSLLDLASKNDEVDVLQLDKSVVDRWLGDWDVSAEEKSAFLHHIADAFVKAGNSETAYLYLAAHLSSLPAGSPKAAPLAQKTIAAAVQLPTVFNFDALLKIDAIHAVKDHPLYSLLKIYLNNGLDEYLTWENANGQVIEEFSLEKAVLQKKIRLLTLASLGSKHVGKELSYAQIASTLQIPEHDVERWVIDVTRVKLLSGKLSQPTKMLHVTRSTSRAFGKEEWEVLEKRLLVWRTGLADVLEVVAGTKKGNAPPLPQATSLTT